VKTVFLAATLAFTLTAAYALEPELQVEKVSVEEITDTALWAFFQNPARQHLVAPNGDLAFLFENKKPVNEEARELLLGERDRLLAEARAVASAK
jgi:hypothetical protein